MNEMKLQLNKSQQINVLEYESILIKLNKCL